MITLVRTANIHDGKAGEAFTWAIKTVNSVNANIEGVNVQVLRNVGGPTFQLHFVSTYESLAAYDEATKRLEADAGYQELIAEARAAGLFIASSIVDHLYETIA